MSGALSERSGGRNYGVDVLRCLAMLLIVCLHVMNRGGALPSVRSDTALWLYPLRVLASSAVNIYALISGYVMLHSRFRPARIFELWFQVWVLNMVIGLVGVAIDPDAMDTEYWVRYLFPFTQKAYWYFTCYVGVYAFSPLINRAVRSLDRVRAIAVIWMVLLLFSLGATLGYLNQGDPYYVGGGYSVLWLLALYTVGACIRQADFLRRTPTWRLIVPLILILGILTGLYRVVYLRNAPEFLGVLKKRLLDYTSPLITAVGVLMLLLFSRLQVRGRMVKLIAFLSPLTFGVYIIHLHHVIWVPLDGAFRPLLKLPGVLLPFAVILAGFALFSACILLDWLRSLLFRLLRVKQTAARLEQALRRWLNRIVKESNG